MSILDDIDSKRQDLFANTLLLKELSEKQLWIHFDNQARTSISLYVSEFDIKNPATCKISFGTNRKRIQDVIYNRTKITESEIIDIWGEKVCALLDAVNLKDFNENKEHEVLQFLLKDYNQSKYYLLSVLHTQINSERKYSFVIRDFQIVGYMTIEEIKKEDIKPSFL